MENQIQLFTNQLFGNVRSTIINGEPWFIGTDVANCLGYKYPANAIQDHVDPRDKIGGVDKSPTPPITFTDSIGRQQTQYPIWINESGLYSLIFSSKLPAAIEFRYWVTSEVLPTMRKIGFTRSMQVLTEENMKLKGMIEGYQNSNLSSNIDRVEVTEMRNQIIEKIMCSNLSPEQKQYFIQYDPNWEGQNE